MTASKSEFPFRWTCPTCGHFQEDTFNPELGPFFFVTCGGCCSTHDENTLAESDFEAWCKACKEATATTSSDGMPENCEKLIKRYALQPETRELDIPAAQFFTVHTFREYIETPDGFRCEIDWSNGYRDVFFCAEERAIFTWCEGDLDLTIDADEATYAARVQAAKEFYSKAA